MISVDDFTDSKTMDDIQFPITHAITILYLARNECITTMRFLLHARCVFLPNMVMGNSWRSGIRLHTSASFAPPIFTFYGNKLELRRAMRRATRCKTGQSGHGGCDKSGRGRLGIKTPAHGKRALTRVFESV